MRECARDQGEVTARSPTAHVVTEPRMEGKSQHAEASPNRLRNPDHGTSAPDGSTALGANNVPNGSAKKAKFLLDPDETRAEKMSEIGFTEAKRPGGGVCLSKGSRKRE